MYIINATFVVSPAVHGNWYDFFVHKFLPALKSHCPDSELVFSRLLSQQKEQHFTYSLQIPVAEISDYTALSAGVLSEYGAFSAELFDAEVTHFISVLKRIEI